jgi:hypothetical protein
MESTSSDLLEGTRPKRLIRRQGRWYLETVRLVSNGDGVFQPRVQRIEGKTAILETLRRIRRGRTLVEATSDIVSRTDIEDGASFDAVDGSWLPSSIASSHAKRSGNAAPRTPTEAALAAELTLLRASFEGMVARLARLEQQVRRLSDELRAVATTVTTVMQEPPAPPSAEVPAPQSAVAAAERAAPPGPPEAAPEPENELRPPLRLPTMSALVKTLAQLSGQQIALKEMKDAGADFLAPAARFFASWLIDDGNAEVGGILCDAEAAVRLGGGLLMLSHSEIDAQVSADKPSEEAKLSMSEICNNLSSPLNEISGNPHVRSQPLMSLAERVPDWLGTPRSCLVCVHPGGGSLVLVGR